MTKVLQIVRTMAGICLPAGATAVVRLASLEQGGLVPAVSAAENGCRSRSVAAAVSAASIPIEISGR